MSPNLRTCRPNLRTSQENLWSSGPKVLISQAYPLRQIFRIGVGNSIPEKRFGHSHLCFLAELTKTYCYEFRFFFLKASSIIERIVLSILGVGTAFVVFLRFRITWFKKAIDDLLSNVGVGAIGLAIVGPPLFKCIRQIRITTIATVKKMSLYRILMLTRQQNSLPRISKPGAVCGFVCCSTVWF